MAAQDEKKRAATKKAAAERKAQAPSLRQRAQGVAGAIKGAIQPMARGVANVVRPAARAVNESGRTAMQLVSAQGPSLRGTVPAERRVLANRQKTTDSAVAGPPPAVRPPGDVDRFIAHQKGERAAREAQAAQQARNAIGHMDRTRRAAAARQGGGAGVTPSVAAATPNTKVNGALPPNPRSGEKVVRVTKSKPVTKPAGKKGLSAFETAFDTARRAGKSTFEHGGRSYTTRRADDKPAVSAEKRAGGTSTREVPKPGAPRRLVPENLPSAAEAKKWIAGRRRSA